MSELFVNTVQFRFPPGSPRPSWMEVASFMKRLDTDVMLIETVYKTAHDRSLFVKFASREAMEESLRKNAEPLQFVYASGKSIEVQMSIAGTNVRYIRIFDLPPELSDESLSVALGAFGKVHRVIREKFPPSSGLGHISTGVRGVHMDVEINIPSTIGVANREGRVYYDGLKETCFSCQAVGHRKDACPQRQAQNKMGKQKQISYAGIVSGNVVTPVENHSEETLPDEIIEVLEEEEETDRIQLDVCGLEDRAETISTEETISGEKGDALEGTSNCVQEVVANPQAAQRRAQFAASSGGSNSSSVPRPKKKCIRRVFY